LSLMSQALGITRVAMFLPPCSRQWSVERCDCLQWHLTDQSMHPMTLCLRRRGRVSERRH
jgi:hypothetical protein